MKQQIIKWTLFGLQFVAVLGLLYWFPWMQNRIPALQAPELQGAYTVEQRPNFFLYSWLKGRYQIRMETFVKEDRQTRPLLLRLRNQRSYDWFGKSPNSIVVFGQDGYLFNKTYIDNWLGRNSLEEETVKTQIDKLSAIRSYLQQNGTELLVTLPPNKPICIPEKLPQVYQKAARATTNRERYRQALDAAKIPTIYFDHFSLDNSREPFLYPRGGQHLSHVGATFAMDTIAGRMEEMLGIQLTEIQIKDYEYDQDIRKPDNELAEVLNLYHPYRENDSMIYPVIQYQRGESDAKPNLLILGDSFYHNMMKMGFHQELFSSQSTFWKYFNRIVTPENQAGTYLNKEQLNLLKELENRDMVLLMIADINLDQFGYGFVEELYEQISQ